MKRTVKLMVVGGTGVGKTFLCSTFKKVMMAFTEPNSEDTFLNNPQLKKNVVDYKYFVPTDAENTLQVFKDLNSYVALARERAEKGEIESFALDNLTYLAENRFIYINKYEPTISSRSGEVDMRAAYGKLSRWLYQFVVMSLLTIKANVVVSCHEKLESDEVMEKKPDKSSPVVPSILGGFRDDCAGLFSGVFYLNKIVDGSGYKYLARTNLGNGRLAKNRWNLPSVIENISYDTIWQAILKSETK